MIVLDTDTKFLEAFLGGAVAANAIPVAITYTDQGNVGNDSDSIGANVNLNNATPVPLVGPDFGAQLRIDFITVVNRDTAPITITFRINDTPPAPFVVHEITLQPGESDYYKDGNWQGLNPDGSDKSDPAASFGDGKKIAQVTVSNVESLVYTVPATKQIEVTHIRAVNAFAGVTKFRMEHDTVEILPFADIVQGGWGEWDGQMFLEAGDTIHAEANQVNGIKLTIYGLER